MTRILPVYHDAMEFAEYGMDRDLPDWLDPDYNLPILELGPGKVKQVEKSTPHEWPDWDAEKDPLPYSDESVGGVYATHLLEHLSNPLVLIREVSRILAPGCPFNIVVPHARADIYLAELDHKTPFVLETFEKLVRPNRYFDKTGVGLQLRFRLGANFLWGVKEANLCIVTQLIKEG